ncbi:amidohydrolase family protein [Patulibacter defluvii]|uniref:amidohydrolase family protein n=1 Tax=Patulibacter defluvii TaxID=3095358 RepID=UPI002A755977|nr:amidohydrolase family protein [Patulibacter sp. DM4]
MTRTIVHGGPVLDARTGSFHDGVAVVIEQGRVVELLRDGAVPGGDGDARVIDVAGRHVLPGLIDAHCHLMSRSGVEADAELVTKSVVDGVLVARRAIEAGVTTVRDPGCKHRGIYELRREIAAGRVLGPRTFAAGPNVVGSGAPVDWRNVFADGPDEVRKVVRKEVLAGADFVKLVLSHTTGASRWRTCLRYMTDEEIAVAVSEAHALGVRTGCHCEGLEAARAAVEAGMDVIDHGTWLDEALVARMAEQGTVLVPTLWAFSAATHHGYNGTISDAQLPDFAERMSDVHRASVQRAMAAGVTIAAGTDPIHWVPAMDLMVREAETLTAAGMGRPDVLRAVTRNGAIALGREDELGALEPGCRGDVLVVDGDPASDLRALARPVLVVKDGQPLIDLLDDRAAAERHWAAIAEPQPLSDRQPEVWLERA